MFLNMQLIILGGGGEGFVGNSVSLQCWLFCCCNTANSLHATPGSYSSVCNAVLWLNALDFPPDMPASSSDAADRLRSLDGAFHTSINVTRCSVLHVWRTVVWSGNIEDRLSKDNTFHTCYLLTITFLVVFRFQFQRLPLSSEENTSTSGHLNVGILNHIHQQKQHNKITNCTQVSRNPTHFGAEAPSSGSLKHKEVPAPYIWKEQWQLRVLRYIRITNFFFNATTCSYELSWFPSLLWR